MSMTAAHVVCPFAGIALEWDQDDAVRATRGPTYAHFWGNWGAHPWSAATAMIMSPLKLLGQVGESGIFRVLSPFLFLPIVGWRWCVGMAPLVVLYAASRMSRNGSPRLRLNPRFWCRAASSLARDTTLVSFC